MIFQRDTTKRFWKWFVKNKQKLEQFISTKDRTDYRIFNELSDQIKRVNSDLIAELTMKEDSFVLVISCDGIYAGIEHVQRLAANAPNINNWTIRKFRHPMDPKILNYQGLELELDNLFVDFELDMKREKVDITYYIPNFDDEDKRYKSLGFLFLDLVIGEFNMMTRVGCVDFEEMNRQEPHFIGLVELRTVIEQNLY